MELQDKELVDQDSMGEARTIQEFLSAALTFTNHTVRSRTMEILMKSETAILSVSTILMVARTT